MSKWDKIADQQFRSMPKDFQEDWGDLRQLIDKHSD